ncbi:hypothetical protein B0T16DRAFT_450817 [Cercophora newfieldiana]|uniref:Uncharacterized protein n=1 Tax=Cercophora newfieldiana TaxID=92897 RepID=A0AA39YND9_9PEZI|nr:hypothetical protein B0T16DRAFT_450817 [Cercophora newfieldiana]
MNSKENSDTNWSPNNNGASWDVHPAYVSALLEQEGFGSDNISAPTLVDPALYGQVMSQVNPSASPWQHQGSNDLASSPSHPMPHLPYSFAAAAQAPPFHVDPRLGAPVPNGNWQDSILDSGGQMPAMMDDHSYHPPALFMPALPLAPHPRLPKEGWTQAQQDMLIKGRQAGQGFTEISNEMRVKLGVEISPNALVKRFQKIQETHLGPLSTAINNAKPDIMACIKGELEKLGLDALPQADKQALDEIMQDFHRSIPKLVQARVYRKRKAAQSFSSSQFL